MPCLFRLARLFAPALIAASTGLAHAQPSDKDEAHIYDSAAGWLCLPGRSDACSGDESTTIVNRDGTRMRMPWAPAHDPLIDCFYVYPTISEDPTGNSSLTPGPGEIRAVRQQFARFASVCRPYAPMYRQVTLAGFASLYSSNPMKLDVELAYSDVRAAWQHYLKYDNHGRGVVLIGHSQGARILLRLIQDEIDKSEERSRLVAALLIGISVDVPEGQTVGGSFANVPLCTSPGQTGCVVSFMSFRATSPPLGMPAGLVHFGYSGTPGMQAACTDPVILSGKAVDAALPVSTNLLGDPSSEPSWKKLAATVDTPFVSFPGYIDARCVFANHASYLAITIHPDNSAWPLDIPGDLVVRGRPLPSWGLHLDDMNLVLGNLIEIVRLDGKTFALAAHSSH